MKLSVVIPAYNEAGSIEGTISNLYATLTKYGINHEILVTNDNSKDDTEKIIQDIMQRVPTLVCFTNPGPNGFGYAVRYGLERFTGDCVAVMMADLSDDPEDLVKFYHKMMEGNYDCVFGTRFSKGGKVVDYPKLKLLINRFANFIVRISVRIR